ncbi:hypothetical protein LQK65_003214 [Vibrio parahaemolyticus]|nr:hypothetical protein [Vibrio parahaemolyticus]EGR3325627.1 hypothetical protein [Vibrio parahaemolyticus]EIO4082772.1 hypothetical protein [Vibrio parahaemolyticus]MBE3762039.1 hypothetical protein [Vibrio parahaemolyticus]
MRPQLPVFIGREHKDFDTIFNSYTKPLKMNLWFCAIWLVGLATVVVLMNTIDDLKPEQETVGGWFERSGALVGVCGMLVEFRLKTVDSIIHSASMRFTPDVFQVFVNYEKYKGYFHKLALSYAIIGAIMWSYGSPVLFGLEHISIWLRS